MKHTAICADNARVLPTLNPGYDLVFFDPPYNTGRDASRHSYNNHFTGDEWTEQTLHRLKLSWGLMAADAVLIFTIDERSLGKALMMCAQVTSKAPQIVSVRTLRSGNNRAGFRRTGEFYLFLHKGKMKPLPVQVGPEWRLTGRTASGLKSTAGNIRWNPLFRSGANNGPESAPNCVYPVWAEGPGDAARVVAIGGKKPSKKAWAIWPTNKEGRPGRWRLRPENAQALFDRGLMRLGKTSKRGRTPVYYLPKGQVAAIDQGLIEITGYTDRGVTKLNLVGDRVTLPGTIWDVSTHDYITHGTELLKKLVPDSKFTHPKSVYAVADALRFYPTTRILDPYAGSGTTAHAAMILNKADELRGKAGLRSTTSISLDEGGEFHRTLAQRLEAATRTAVKHNGVLAGYTGVLPGEVEAVVWEDPSVAQAA